MSTVPSPPWGIISIKVQAVRGAGGASYPHPHAPPAAQPQDGPAETPMQPITMLRNALGKEEGGSGVPLDRAKYAASVAYWSAHAAVA